MSNTPWYRRRWLKIALVAVVATLLGVRIGVTIWGRSHLAKFVQDTTPMWDEERARLETLRNPLDPSAKEPCATAYLAAGVDLGASARPVGMALLGSPRDKVPDEARAIVAAERGAIEGFSGPRSAAVTRRSPRRRGSRTGASSRSSTPGGSSWWTRAFTPRPATWTARSIGSSRR